MPAAYPEPQIPDTAKRADIRINGTAAPRGVLTEYDLTIISPTTAEANAITNSSDVQELVGAGRMEEAARLSLKRMMAKAAGRKEDHYQHLMEDGFIPLVLTADGVEDELVTATFKHWRSVIPTFSYTLNLIAAALIKMRAISWRL
ncbi:hypothetical protein OC834_003076 [Tilletia horrida]|nr:hypothetical protein OC834_003076 [Tilletia horrida]